MQRSNIVLTAIAAMCGAVLFAFTASATTIDPSNYDHSMTISPAPGKVTTTFAAGATVDVKLGSRALRKGDKVISWAAQPDATFTGRGYTFESRSDGLYVASVPGGFTIIVR